MVPLPAEFSGPILVVRRDNIGDLVCTTPLIEGLRTAFPKARIEALANSYNAQVLARNPALDAINVYTKLKHRDAETSAWTVLSDRFRLLRSLRRRRFQLAVLARSGFDRHGLAFIRWLGIPRVVGFASPDGRAPGGLTYPLPPPDNANLHEVEAVAQLASALGIAQTTGPLRIFPDPARRDQFQRRFAGRPAIAVHISAREASRRLPEERWVAAIKGILEQRRDSTVALFWAPGREDNPMHPGDDDKAARILAAFPGLPVVPCPTEQLEDLMAGLAACQAFIGTDGGALHVAVGLGLPCVALFENSPFKRIHWAPWRVPSVVVSAPVFAIADIEAQAIVQGFLSLPE